MTNIWKLFSHYQVDIFPGFTPEAAIHSRKVVATIFMPPEFNRLKLADNVNIYFH